MKLRQAIRRDSVTDIILFMNHCPPRNRKYVSYNFSPYLVLGVRHDMETDYTLSTHLRGQLCNPLINAQGVEY